mmetsp:Transcript_1894/g.4938  ORF Transcript_1894/g.4938 Transcript_1894/m.4938 type:complete len:376 (+) Transcript_1894:1222-2349(+)
MGRCALATMGPHSSTGSPITFMMRPRVSRPTGTEMGEPVLLTVWPRDRPSVVSMAMVRTVFSPVCCATSRTRRTSWPSTSSASMILGIWPSNWTSTTAPITWVTLPAPATATGAASAAKPRATAARLGRAARRAARGSAVLAGGGGGWGGGGGGGVDPYERTPPERKAHHGDGQHQMRTAGARGQRQHAAYPYGYQDGAGGAISYEMEQRLKLAEHDAAMRAAVADGCPGYARGQHPGQQDHLGSIMKGGYAGQEDSYDWPRPGQHRAVDAHTAGRPQQMDSHRGAAPFAFDDTESSKRSGGKSDNPDLWNVSIPQHGRRRAADLAITGPSLRGNSAHGGGGGANAARYDYQGAITSTTTYATPSMAPSTFFGGR